MKLRSVLLAAAALTLCATHPSGAQETPRMVPAEILELAEAAALGDSVALYNLGVEYFRGEAVPQDYARSAAFWRRAVERGIVPAMNNLGYLLMHGMGVPAAPEEAVALWRQAVLHGQLESHVHLAWASRNGLGTPTDPVEAYARYLTARRLAERSTDPADGWIPESVGPDLDEVRATLSPAQLREAESRADSYVAEATRPAEPGR